jgi:hypothetical protein
MLCPTSVCVHERTQRCAYLVSWGSSQELQIAATRVDRWITDLKCCLRHIDAWNEVDSSPCGAPRNWRRPSSSGTMTPGERLHGFVEILNFRILRVGIMVCSDLRVWEDAFSHLTAQSDLEQG